MAQVSVSSIIDRSMSMPSYHYLEPAKTDAATFVSIMHEADQIGLVAIDQTSPVLYNLTTLDANHTTIRAALAVISAIQGQGNTNMKNAVTNSHAMLGSATNSAKAIIMLSDGEYNTGGDPLVGLPTDIPIYTIALGQSAGIQTLQTIASRTSGKYYYSPDAFELAAIYNQIANDAHVAQVSLNKRQQLPSYQFSSFPLQVAANTSHISLAVNWLNSAINYTPGTPGVNQMTVMLRDPNNQKVDPPPTFSGGEFVTFHLHDPAPGQWTVGCWCGNVPNNLFQGTMGGFEPTSTTALAFNAPQSSYGKGDPIVLGARLETNGRALSHLHVQAHTDSPSFSTAEILQRHAKRLKAITLDAKLRDDSVDEIRAKLTTLHRELLGRENIFARKRAPIDCTGQIDRDGAPGITLPPFTLDTAGEHSVILDVAGRYADCGSDFTRCQRVSLSVTG